MDEEIQLPEIPKDAKADAIRIIKENWAVLIESLVQRAKGVYVDTYETGKNGLPVARTYTIPPDREAAIYLMNQVMGKPDVGLSEEEKVTFIMDDV